MLPPTSIEQMTDMIEILKMAIACEKRGMHMYRQVYIADNANAILFKIINGSLPCGCMLTIEQIPLSPFFCINHVLRYKKRI